MKLSILMCALTSRDWVPLYRNLQRQCKRVGNAEILVFCDGGTITSGEKRNILTSSAGGEYIAFVDDDDLISSSYVSAIVAGCNSNKDVITFDCDMTINGTEKQRQSFTLAGDDRTHKGGVKQMTANHLCAWHADIARSCKWDNGLGYGDDQVWYKSLLKAYDSLTETHIDEVLYHYNFNHSTTANQTAERVIHAKLRYKSGGYVYRRTDGSIFTTNGPSNKAGSFKGVIHIK